MLLTSASVVLLMTSLVSSSVIAYQAAYDLFPRRPTRVAALATSLIDALKDAETGQRGFLITDKEEFLQPYNAALPSVRVILTQLKEARPVNDRMLDELTGLADLKVEEMAVKIRERRNGSDFGVADIQAGKVVMDKIRVHTNMLVKEEDRHVAVRTAAQAAVTVMMVAVFVTVLTAAALVRFRSRPPQTG